MILDLGDELQRAAVEPPAPDVLAAVRARTRRRTRNLVALVLAAVLLIGAAAGGWWWWTNRPIPNSFGEPAPTAEWRPLGTLTGEQVKARCGAGFEDQTGAEPGGNVTSTDGQKQCNVGWERGSSKEELKALPTGPAAIRPVCERSGKDLTGWQLVATSSVTVPAGGDAKSADWLMAMFRSANGWVVHCWATVGEGAVSVSVDPDRTLGEPGDNSGSVYRAPTVMAFAGEADDSRNTMVTIYASGRVNLSTRLLRRASTVRVHVSDAVADCEAQVTNGYVEKWCLTQVATSAWTKSAPAPKPDDTLPATVVVLDGKGRELSRQDV